MHLRVCLITIGLVPAHAFLSCRPLPHRRTPFNTARPIMSAAGHDSDMNVLPANALSFMRVVGKLKELKRTGWVHRGVAKPESVSDHMYRMAMCSFLITDPTLDRSRIMKLAMVHDLAEALAGDIAPFQNVSKEDKRRLEEEGLDKICATIGSDPIALEIKKLWYEYEDCTSEEARVVKDLDKLEMIVQADDYEKGQGLDLGEFFESTQGCFTTPQQVQSWDKELREQRATRRQEEKPSNQPSATTSDSCTKTSGEEGAARGDADTRDPRPGP
ncbi:unnamed protein product [Ectocarpus fasciculatus]